MYSPLTLRLAPVALLFLAGSPMAQAANHPGMVVWGSQRYVEYIVGNAPLILALPHGGYLKPPGVKNRTYGVTVQDARTQETGQEIAEKFRSTYGLHPYVVISHLHRIKLDPNREIVEAAQGDKTAEQAWRDFHGFLDTARRAVGSQYGKGLFLEIHGHAHSQNWIELGYLLSAADLNQSDTKLNASNYVNKSCVRALAVANSTVAFSELIRGKSSLGGLLETAGLYTVPAPNTPGPGSNSYFKGGYDVRRWGSQPGGTVDAIQIELPSTMRRDLVGRGKFTTALVTGLGPFFDKYYGIKLGDGPRVSVTASVEVGTEAGGTAEFEFARTGSTTSPLTVSFLVGGSATPAQDYKKLPASVTIAANEFAARLRVEPVQDATAEGQETVTVTLLPGAATAAPRIGESNSATAILLDDESDPRTIGHWPLDESSGTFARDISGANRNGSLLPTSGGPSHVSGMLTRALDFDESNDHMLIADFDYASRGALTLSFWFRAPKSAQSSTQYLFSHGDVLGANSLNVYRFEATGLLRTWIRCNTDINASILLDVTTDFMDDQWHFYTLTVEATFDYASVYIDGARHARGRLGGDDLDPTGSIHVGARHDLSSSRFFRGRIDDLILQSRHLTETEAKELFDVGTGYARSYGVGCKTSAGSVPQHTLQGGPSFGALVVLEVRTASPLQTSVFYFGFSRSQFGGVPLPLDLKFLGAPSCLLLQDALLMAPVGLFLGKGSLNIVIPANPSLRGLRAYSQVMVLDKSANTAGLAVSNGLTTAIGG
jgi:N-formylglutamate amidohydrolase